MKKILDIKYLGEKKNNNKKHNQIVFNKSTMTRSDCHPYSTRDKSKNVQKL